ncbi:uncharacterized protein FN964_003745 [Alca torda]
MSQNNRHYSDSSCAGGTYHYFSRNIPHPRMVCHMPGLNNALVCVVRSSFSQEHPSAGNTVILQPEADQEEHVLTGNTRTNSRNLPRLEGFLRRERGTSRPTTQGHADLPERIQSGPTLSEKLLKKRFQASAQPASRQGVRSVSVTQPSSPFVNLRHGPHVQQNVNGDLSYLDQDIKVRSECCSIWLPIKLYIFLSLEDGVGHYLSNLLPPVWIPLTWCWENLDKFYRQIRLLRFRNGSQGQVQKGTHKFTPDIQISKWELQLNFCYLHISEKDFVSSMIFSEPTDKGVLNSKEGTAEHINTQTLPSLQRGPEQKKNQSR